MPHTSIVNTPTRYLNPCPLPVTSSGDKGQARSPKAEGRKKSEIRRPKCEGRPRKAVVREKRTSRVSGLGLRTFFWPLATVFSFEDSDESFCLPSSIALR